MGRERERPRGQVVKQALRSRNGRYALAWFCLCAILLFPTMASGQIAALEQLTNATETEAAPVEQPEENVEFHDEKLEQLRQDLEDATSLTQEDKQQLGDLLAAAEKSLDEQKEREGDLQNSREIVRNAETIVADLDSELAAATNYAPANAQLQRMSGERLNALLASLLEQQLELETDLGDFRERQKELVTLPDELKRQIEEARRKLSERSQSVTVIETESSSIGARIEDYVAQVETRELNQEISYAREKIGTIPALQKVNNMRLTLARKQSELLASDVSRIERVADSSSQRMAQNLLAKAQRDARSVGSQDSDLTKIAQDSVNLAERLGEILKLSSRERQRATRMRDEINWLESSEETIAVTASSHRLNEEIKELLLEIEARLPSELRKKRLKAEGDETIAELSVQGVLWAEQRRQLDSDNYARALLGTAANSGESLERIEGDRLDQLVSSRVELLDALIDANEEALQRVNDNQILLQEALDLSASVEDSLNVRLAWTPTNSFLAKDWFPALGRSLAWVFSGEIWATILTETWAAVKDQFVLLLLLAGGLYLLVKNIGRLGEYRSELDSRVGDVKRDSIWVTPMSMLATFLIALPYPLAIGGIGIIIDASDQVGVITNAFGTALWFGSFFYYVLSAFWRMAVDGSLFELHFHSPIAARRYLFKYLRNLTSLQAIAITVFIFANGAGNADLQRTVGLIAFTVISVALAAALFLYFRVSSRVSRPLKGDEKPSLLYRAVALLSPLLPILIGLFALFGYFRAAIQFQASTLFSGVLLLAAALLYGVLNRAILVIRKRSQYRLWLEEQGEEGEDVGIEFVGDEETIDYIEDRTDRLLRIFILAVVTIGLVGVWRNSFPILGVLDRIVLWNSSSLVGGEAVQQSTTAWDVLLAMGIVFVAVICIRVVSGLISVSGKGSGNIDTGNKYAMVSLGSYVVMAGAILFAFLRMGISWDDAQWIVAALGVGLGFGLQEIMANFVSGMIILFERPIRVGDMVTIGEITGRVKNVRIRATTIIDFDNREVVLPNKSIITENVTNWTLNNQVTRLIVPIGVAYGSDVDRVLKLLDDVAHSVKDVSDDPEPQILFTEHADSSLNFEIRVHIDKPQNRLTVLSEINSRVNAALAEAGIEIPFPQQDVHLVSMPEKMSTDAAKEAPGKNPKNA